MATNKFSNEQLRGAWRAGYEAGVKDGEEGTRRESWRNPLPGENIPKGTRVKLLVETCFGLWKGKGTLADDTRGRNVHIIKDGCDDPNDWTEHVQACQHEIMIQLAPPSAEEREQAAERHAAEAKRRAANFAGAMKRAKGMKSV